MTASVLSLSPVADSAMTGRRETDNLRLVSIESRIAILETDLTRLKSTPVDVNALKFSTATVIGIIFAVASLVGFQYAILRSTDAVSRRQELLQYEFQQLKEVVNKQLLEQKERK